MRDGFLGDHLPHVGLGLAACAAVTTTCLLILWPPTVVAPAPARDRRKTAPSPKWTVLPALSTLAKDDLPYPPDVLPGARDVATPYGNLRVYEWGPEDGERVLLLHGIGTPCLAMGATARGFVERGWRVMTFGEWLFLFPFLFLFFLHHFTPFFTT